MPSRYSNEKYSDRKGYVGPNNFGAWRRDFVSRRLNRIAWRHDLQYMRTKDPYTTYNRADRKFINKIEKYLKKTPDADDWLIAQAAKKVFETERGILAWNEDHAKGATNLPEKLINQPFPESLRQPMPYAGTKRLRESPFMSLVKHRTWAPRGRNNLRHLKNCVEYKFKDTTVDSSSRWSIPLVTCLTAGVTQGSTDQTRQGNKIFISKLQLNMRLQHPAGTYHAAARVLLFIDTEGYQNAASPTAADLLASSEYIAAFRNLNHTSRFKVLMDKRIVLSPSVATTGDSSEKAMYLLRKTINFKNGLIQQYSGTGGAESDITKNAIYVMVLTNDDTAGAITAKFTSRIRFTD